jgi:hypothetical protein
VKTTDARTYTVRVSNAVGAATSSNAIFDVPIQFTISCTNQSVNLVSAALSLARQSRLERSECEVAWHEPAFGLI